MFWNRLLLFGRGKRTRTFAVRLNGELIGTVAVGEKATDFEIQMAALALPEVKTRIAERTVMDLKILVGSVVDISA